MADPITTNKWFDPALDPIPFKYANSDLIAQLNAKADADSGDIILTATPATLGSSAAAVNAAIAGAAGKFTREVVVNLKNTEGTVLRWISKTFAIAVAKSSTSGLVAIADAATTVDVQRGTGTVVIEYTGEWAEEDTVTLTVTGGTLESVALGNKTSVDTLVA